VVRIWSKEDCSSHQFVSSPYWLKDVLLDRARIDSHCVGFAAARSVTRLASAIGLKCTSDARRKVFSLGVADAALARIWQAQSTPSTNTSLTRFPPLTRSRLISGSPLANRLSHHMVRDSAGQFSESTSRTAEKLPSRVLNGDGDEFRRKYSTEIL